MSAMTAPVDDALVSVTRERAAAMAEVSPATLAYWDRTGVVAPSTARAISEGGRVIRLYDFQRTLGVLVAAELRRRGISLQGLRKLVHRMLDEYAQPLSELTWASEGKRVYIQMPDGAWEDGFVPGQSILISRVDVEALRVQIRASIRRPDTYAGQIEKRRGTLGSKPVFRGTRIPVDTVRKYLAHGRSVEQILESFPGLTEADIHAVA